MGLTTSLSPKGAEELAFMNIFMNFANLSLLQVQTRVPVKHNVCMLDFRQTRASVEAVLQ